MAEAINLLVFASGSIAANGNSADLNTYDADSLDFHMNITVAAGGIGTLQMLLEVKGLDGIYYQIYDSTALGVTATSKSIGAGLELAKTFGDLVRLRWVIASGGVTASYGLIGRKTARTNAP